MMNRVGKPGGCPIHHAGLQEAPGRLSSRGCQARHYGSVFFVEEPKAFLPQGAIYQRASPGDDVSIATTEPHTNVYFWGTF